jgi:uncharacterized protein YjaZ
MLEEVKMKRILIVLFSYLFFAFVMVSCANRSEDQSSSVFEFSHNNQKFEIISLYDEVLNYTAEIKSDPPLENKIVYNEKVIMPFYNLAKDKKLEVDGFNPFFAPTLLEQRLEDNTKELLRNQKKINELIQKAFVTSAEWISGGDKTIFVLPFNPDHPSIIKDMEGVSGGTLNENVILLLLDPSFSEEALKYTVAHEYNHAIAMESGGRDYSILSFVIMEGKADSFAGILYPEKKVAWLEPMSTEAEQIVLDEIKGHRGSPTAVLFRELFDGNYNKGIPRWANYKIGYNIMQSFLKNNPDMTIDEWTRLDYTEIVQGSQYGDFLQ